jgi:hypothetical protein
LARRRCGGRGALPRRHLVVTARPALDFDAAELDLALRAQIDEHA